MKPKKEIKNTKIDQKAVFPDFVSGEKIDMVQKFDSEGKRLVVTRISVQDDYLGEIFKPGDQVKVTGHCKGKGFTGVMKRWGFKGGPRTHGQSDRERAPGSIGQSATPGRVFPGKKMPGRAGGHKVTIAGLKIFAVQTEKKELLVTGVVPGARKGRLKVTKVKKGKNAER